MKQDIKQRWVKALKSGEYEQGVGALRNGRDQFCCLGVLVDLAVQDGVCQWQEPNNLEESFLGIVNPDGSKVDTGTIPEIVRKWAGLDECNPRVYDVQAGKYVALATVNDYYQSPFSRVAEWIDVTDL